MANEVWETAGVHTAAVRVLVVRRLLAEAWERALVVVLVVARTLSAEAVRTSAVGVT